MISPVSYSHYISYIAKKIARKRYAPWSLNNVYLLISYQPTQNTKI